MKSVVASHILGVLVTITGVALMVTVVTQYETVLRSSRG
ncbi:MAG: hypothetical protein QOE61_379 [Micromonosporaceae bacterium]|jgi:hypothetical protein|nr:hypothetical protein [Micromonosporaceae bacterium]